MNMRQEYIGMCSQKERKNQPMNKCEADILRACKDNPGSSQRSLSRISGYSLGMVNKSIKSLQNGGLLDAERSLTQKAENLLAEKRPQNAVILAAGYGMRMVPINTEISKGLLEVHGKPLIERQIEHLQEAGVKNIYIVVGYMKEQYEYLMDQYNVHLIVNMSYAEKNNLFSLLKASAYISNTYIVPCDIYARENPFSSCEMYSWYMVSDEMAPSSTVRVNHNGKFSPVPAYKEGNRMIGISYIDKEDAPVFMKQLQAKAGEPGSSHCFWEDALFGAGAGFGPFSLLPKVISSSQVVEIDTYEQLREIDENSNQLNTPAIQTISEAMNIKPEEIVNIRVLKKGMTNRSFLFEARGQKYIMRIPGEGTDQLINRKEEAQVYEVISPLHLSDDIVYINPENGFKITRFLEDTHTCDPDNPEELQACMRVLRSFHRKQLKVDHDFDVFGQIEFYESLRNGPSVFRDYGKTKADVLRLKPFIEALDKDCCLCHIDAVPDNFLIEKNGNIRLIDWEYAGNQDPHLDLAMFCVYAMYDKEQTDRLIDLYFGLDEENPKPDETTRYKIYAYIAMSGLLWSNWCEFKRTLGLEFGVYAIKQYRFAKEYARLVLGWLDQKS